MGVKFYFLYKKRGPIYLFLSGMFSLFLFFLTKERKAFFLMFPIFLELFLTRVVDDMEDYEEDVREGREILEKRELSALLRGAGHLFLLGNLLLFGWAGVFSFGIFLMILEKDRFFILQSSIGVVSAFYYLGRLIPVSRFGTAEYIFLGAVFVASLLFQMKKWRKRREG